MIEAIAYLVMYSFVAGSFFTGLLFYVENMNEEPSDINTYMPIGIASVLWPISAPAVFGAWLVSKIVQFKMKERENGSTKSE